MPTPLSILLPAPTGVQATFYGDATGGATTRYYWIQAIYPSGKSTLTRSQAMANMLASLNRANQIELSWNPMAGAIGYNIYYTTTTTAPTNGSILVATVSAPGFTDQGQSNSGTLQTGYVVPDGFRVARGRYDFALDGGVIGLINISLSDLIPAGAILLGGTINPVVAVTSAGAATLAVGTSAGSSASSILAATAKASLTLDALINVVPVFATPVKMTADGYITVTVATAALTAGVVEIFVFYVLPIAL